MNPCHRRHPLVVFPPPSRCTEKLHDEIQTSHVICVNDVKGEGGTSMCSSSFQTSPNNPRRAIRTVQVARPVAWARPLADGSHLGRGLHRTCRRSPALSGTIPGRAGRRGGRWRHSEAHGPSPHRAVSAGLVGLTPGPCSSRAPGVTSIALAGSFLHAFTSLLLLRSSDSGLAGGLCHGGGGHGGPRAAWVPRVPLGFEGRRSERVLTSPRVKARVAGCGCRSLNFHSPSGFSPLNLSTSP